MHQKIELVVWLSFCGCPFFLNYQTGPACKYMRMSKGGVRTVTPIANIPLRQQKTNTRDISSNSTKNLSLPKT